MKLTAIKEKKFDTETFFKSTCFFHGTTLRTYVYFLRTSDLTIYRIYMEDFLDEICSVGCDVNTLLKEKITMIGELAEEKEIWNIEKFDWEEV